MSIFESLYLSQRKLSNFWQELNPLSGKVASEQVLIKEELSFRYQSSALSTYEVFLTNGCMYFHVEQRILVCASVKWCLIESFYETSETGETLFGFSVVRSDSRYDFFTKDSKSLENWMNQLSFIAIMADFEASYVTIKTIDSGQFGTVSLCQDLYTGDSFAVKNVKKSKLKDKKTLNYLYNEVKIMRKIEHPSIIKLYKVFEDDENVSLVLEYAPYGNLFRKISETMVFTEHDVLAFTKNLFEVLHYLHSLGIIHRDLKPENILMFSKESISQFKIADFGLSCYLDKNEMACLGSPGYIAPEMLRGASYGTKVDIFSAGIIVFILITGIAPFNARSTQKIIEKNVRCVINFEAPIKKRMSSVAHGFLKDVLDSNPSLRPSADEALSYDWLKFRKYSDSDTNTTVKCEREFISFSRIAESYRVNNY